MQLCVPSTSSTHARACRDECLVPSRRPVDTRDDALDAHLQYQVLLRHNTVQYSRKMTRPPRTWYKVRDIHIHPTNQASVNGAAGVCHTRTYQGSSTSVHRAHIGMPPHQRGRCGGVVEGFIDQRLWQRAMGSGSGPLSAIAEGRRSRCLLAISWSVSKSMFAVNRVSEVPAGHETSSRPPAFRRFNE